MTEWLTDSEQQAWRALLAMVSRLQGRLNRELLADSGLSLADYDVLVPLSEAGEGRLRVFELSRHLGWEQSRLSHHLARMQRRGLVGREECQEDKRGAFVVLTDHGRAALMQAVPGHVRAVRELVFDALGAEQVSAVRQVSELVLTRLEGDHGRGAPVDS